MDLKTQNQEKRKKGREKETKKMKVMRERKRTEEINLESKRLFLYLFKCYVVARLK